MTITKTTIPAMPRTRDRKAMSFRVRQLVVAMLTLLCLRAQTPPAEVVTEPLDWPREYAANGARLVLYQPQIEEWENQVKLRGRLAASVTPAGAEEPRFGALRIEATTNANTEERTVYIDDFKITDASFPARDEETSRELEELARGLFPVAAMTVSLDRLAASVERDQIQPREVKVNLEPPPIFASQRPAVLVMFDGKPIEADIDGTDLKWVLNTNWDVLYVKSTKQYFLRDEDLWLTAASVEGPWNLATEVPAEFTKLPDNENWAAVKQHLSAPVVGADQLPTVFISFEPAELIVTEGKPKLDAIPGTTLMYVSNTEADVFFNTADRYFYFLTAGRWFRSAAPAEGDWEAATMDLPAEFGRIPRDHAKANALASVAGTEEAEEAVLLASVPKTATIDRQGAEAEVTYFGDPNFEAIEGTSMSYAVNTPQDVIQASDGKYYLCEQGVWFYSYESNGPWELCDAVPPEIYTIPSDHQKHNVTYVQAYESAPDSVTYGYTGGYTGTYVSIGLCFWGGGWYHPPYYWGWGPYRYPYYWPRPYYSYGVRAAYNPRTGTFYRGASVYGPWGGYGRGAAYNPRTGSFYRGAGAWGPGGAAWGGFGYNPRTGNWRSGGAVVDYWNDAYAAGRRGGNQYGRWGEAVVGQGDDWARVKGARTEDKAVLAGKSSEGGRVIVGGDENTRIGLGKDQDNNIYAGKDDNVYKRDEDGNWYQRDGDDWNQVPSDQVEARKQEAQGTLQERAGNLSPEQREQAQSRAQNMTPEQREQVRGRVREASPEQRSQSRGDTGAAAATSQQRIQPGTARAQGGQGRTGSNDVMRSLERDHSGRVQGRQRTERYRSYSSSNSGRSRGIYGRSRPSYGGRGGGFRRRR